MLQNAQILEKWMTMKQDFSISFLLATLPSLLLFFNLPPPWLNNNNLLRRIHYIHLKRKMFPNSESPDKEIFLLNVSRHRRDLWSNRTIIYLHSAPYFHLTDVAVGQHIH